MNEVQQFFAQLLETAGSAVEAIEPEGLEVLAPPPVQQALGLPEWTRLGFGVELPDRAQRITLESDLMARVSALLGERGRQARRRLVVPNPPVANPERVLAQHLDLRNATYRLESVGPAATTCEILSFRYMAVSDEKRDGVTAFGFNRATGATLDEMLPDLLHGAEAAAPEPGSGAAAPLPWTRPQFAAVLTRAVPPRVRRALEPFFRGILRRQERDLQRLLSYHQDLLRESAARLAALAARRGAADKQEAEQARERQRLEAIAREYGAKVADVRQKYAMRVEVEWLQALTLVMPTQRFVIRIKRRKQERMFALDWNPLARALEQLPCEYSYTFERPREVCDEALHLVSPAANGPCPACGKAFCRACHPERCPRCGRAVETAERKE